MSEGKIEYLDRFCALLTDWFEGCYGERSEQTLRREINEMAPRAKNIIKDAGCLQLMNFAPPASIGGVAIQNADPFDVLFTDYYGRSVITDVIDMTHRAIGVLKDSKVNEVAPSYRTHKLRFTQSVLKRYRGMSAMEKLGVFGSLASILGLVLYFVTPQAISEQNNNQAITGSSNSPAIGTNSGSVTINYNNSHSKSAVLRNPSAGATLLVNKPTIMAASQPTMHVCMVPAGTSIMLTGRQANQGPVDMWREVTVIEGDCAGKTGWVAIENVSYE